MASLARLLKRRPVLLDPRRITLTPTPPSLSTVAQFCTSQQTLSPPPPSPSSRAQDEDSKRWSSLLLFLPGAITFGLGTWQIFRRQEKIKMIDYRRKRLEAEPIAWNNISSELASSRLNGDLNSFEFRRVVCEGVFDESKSIYLGPRSRSISGVTENGYYVVTPLIPTKNKSDSAQLPILVNRGWVPRSWRNKSPENPRNSRKSTNISSAEKEESKGSSWWKFWSMQPKANKNQEQDITPVEVMGVIRGNEKPSIFVPANDPSSGQWFYVDIPAMAHGTGLPENIVYIEEINENASASKPYPAPKDVNSLIRHSVMPQDHLNYTLTCSLALIVKKIRFATNSFALQISANFKWSIHQI